MMTRFQLIGSCVQTQTISWDEEMKLISGVPYAIDLDQDFSYDIGYGVRLSTFSAAEAIELLKETERLPDTPSTRSDSYDSYYIREALQNPKKAMKRYEKERERELWGDVKKRKKKKGHKKAKEKRKREWKHFKKALKSIGVKLK